MPPARRLLRASATRPPHKPRRRRRRGRIRRPCWDRSEGCLRWRWPSARRTRCWCAPTSTPTSTGSASRSPTASSSGKTRRPLRRCLASNPADTPVQGSGMLKLLHFCEPSLFVRSFVAGMATLLGSGSVVFEVTSTPSSSLLSTRFFPCSTWIPHGSW